VARRSGTFRNIGSEKRRNHAATSRLVARTFQPPSVVIPNHGVPPCGMKATSAITRQSNPPT
jgi:hypothetical protein